VTEEPLDLKVTLKAIWRQRRLVFLIALIGLMAGVAYGLSKPHQPRAVTQVLLPQPQPGGSLSAADTETTQIVIATSDPVLTQAGQAASPVMTAAELKKHVTVKALSSQILQIAVSARSAGQASLLANAVATDYIHYFDKLPTTLVGATHPSALPSATSVVGSSKLHIAIDGILGLLLGAVLGSIVALLRANRDRRLRSRDEIAGALRAPVLASLEAKRCNSIADWEKLLGHYTPSSVTSWSLRRVLHLLEPIEGTVSDACIIAFAEDGPALAVGPQLTTFGASLGTTIALLPGDHEALIPLRAACAAQQRWTPSGIFSLGLRARNVRQSGWDDEPAGRTANRQMTLSVIAVDRSYPNLPKFNGTILLAVSAGFATAEDLARVGLAAADVELAIDGILVVNPDAKDNTTGIGAETEAPLPLRRTTHRHPSTEPPAAGWPV
jgi:capsular polysaccharide biosynthesis protein